jgi:hypothetical protein
MATNGQKLPSIFTELERIRVSRDWTYKQLAKAIASTTHHDRTEDCWRKLCQGLTPNPHRRTVHMLELFMASPKGRRRGGKATGRRRLARKAQ